MVVYVRLNVRLYVRSMVVFKNRVCIDLKVDEFAAALCLQVCESIDEISDIDKKSLFIAGGPDAMLRVSTSNTISIVLTDDRRRCWALKPRLAIWQLISRQSRSNPASGTAYIP